MALDLATLGIAVDTRQVKEAAKDLDGLAQAGGRAESATKSLSSATDTLSNLYRDVAKAAAAWKVYDLIRDAAMLNARFETMGVVMNVAGRNAGYNRVQMEEYSKALQKSGISMLQSRDALTQLTTAQIDLSRAQAIGRAAQDLAVVANTNSSEAMSRMIHGIKSGQIEVLRTLGLNVNFEESYKALAKEIGVSKDALTEQQKTMARTNAVIQESAAYTGIYEEAMGTASKQIGSMTRYVENAKIILGDTFNEALLVMVQGLTVGLKDLNDEAGKLQQEDQLREWGRDAIKTMAVVGDAARIVVGVIGRAMVDIDLLARKAAYNIKFGGDGVTFNPAQIANRAMDPKGYREATAAIRALSEARERNVDDFLSGSGKMQDAAERFFDAQDKDRAARAAINSVIKDYTDKSKTEIQAKVALIDLNSKGAITGMQLKVALQEVGAATKGTGNGIADHSKEAKKAKSAYDSLIKSIQEKIAVQQVELSLGAQATTGGKDYAKFLTDVTNGHITLTTAQMANAATLWDWYLKNEAAIDSAKEWTKFQQEAERANAQRLTTLEASVQAAEDEIAHFGWSKSAIEADTIARLENNRVIVLAHGATQESLKYLDEEIALRKRLAGAMNQREALDKSVENWKSIEQAAHETWTAVSRDGTDAFKQIGKTLKAAILDALYQMTVKRWIIDISASVSGQGVANQAFGGSGGAMNFLGLGNAASGAANWLNLGGMSSGFASGMSETMLGSSFVGPSASLAGGSTGFAASIGQAAPYVAAALVAANIIQSVWGHKPHDPEANANMRGGEWDISAELGSATPFGAWNPFSYQRAFTADMRPAMDSFMKSINSYDEAISRVISSTQKAAIENKLLADTADRVNFSDFAQGLTQVGEERKRLILDALGGIYKELGQAIPYDQLAAFIGQIDNLKSSLKAISPSLAESPDAVIRAFGGAGNFSGALGQYIEAIYSPEEKQSLMRSQLSAQFDAINLAMPETLAGFRDLVQGLDTTTDAGAMAYAKVISWAPAFAQVANAAADSASDLLDIARRIRGESGATAGARFSDVQAQFAIATAAARAGDSTALGSLSGLQSTLLSLASENVASGTDLRRIRMKTANSLEDTYKIANGRLPSYDVGTNYVPRDMLAMIHEGEAIVPRQYNPAAGGSSNNQRLEALVERLSNEVVMLRAEVRAVVSNTSETSRTLRKVTAEGGNALNTVVVV